MSIFKWLFDFRPKQPITPKIDSIDQPKKRGRRSGQKDLRKRYRRTKQELSKANYYSRKLSPWQIKTIRKINKTHPLVKGQQNRIRGILIRQAAERYGVSTTTIKKIVNNK
jgi:hypothetical protein